MWGCEVNSAGDSSDLAAVERFMTLCVWKVKYETLRRWPVVCQQCSALKGLISHRVLYVPFLLFSF